MEIQKILAKNVIEKTDSGWDRKKFLLPDFYFDGGILFWWGNFLWWGKNEKVPKPEGRVQLLLYNLRVQIYRLFYEKLSNNKFITVSTEEKKYPHNS